MRLLATSCARHIYHFLQSRFEKKMVIRKIKAIFYVKNMKCSCAMLPGKGTHVFDVQLNREKC